VEKIIVRLAGRIRLRGPLSRRIRVSFRVIVTLMLLPALASMSMMLSYSNQYHDVIARIEKVSSLRPLVGETLLNELFNIIAGRKHFDQGGQFELIRRVDTEMDALIAQASSSKMEMTVARRTMDTLAGYVQKMGEQMAAGSTVAMDEQVLEEIRNVSALLSDMLQDAIYAEVNAATDVSNKLQVALQAALAGAGGLLLLTLLFAQIAQRSLALAIGTPIDRLKRFAGKIADGRLDERAQETDVDELQDLNVSLNTMAVKLGNLIEENRREQENLKKSEMRTLQAQITPHFLYNTLDAIVWLAEAKRTGEVIAITRALSDFFRISLSNGQDWITIAQEVEHLKGYLTIQKIRYRDILDYSIDIDAALYGRRILKLTIQPLVENAIYHGIKNRRGGGRLAISARGDGDTLTVKVTDDGVGMTAEQLAAVQRTLAGEMPSADTGYGLYSVDKRLKLYYSQPQGLQVSSVPGEGTEISFRVPLTDRGA
jgi:two-component system, sensor histidine kinase YesM